MIANFHTHSVFCDGKNTPEEIVLTAIQKGFSAIGFSGHGYTDYDLRYCMKDFHGYSQEIKRLKGKYKKDIQIYLGVEEDTFAPVDRSELDYVIGSSHYVYINNRYYPIDSGYDYFKECLAVYDHDVVRFSEAYYQAFCAYIHRRKPDIIGHFDLITKFDELHDSLFLCNEQYNRVAEKYVTEAAKSGSLFEVNTGAIARGLRTTVYPAENLLSTLRKLDAGLILSSDSHNIDTLDFHFVETKKYLKDIGFTHLFTMDNGVFAKYDI